LFGAGEVVVDGGNGEEEATDDQGQ